MTLRFLNTPEILTAYTDHCRGTLQQARPAARHSGKSSSAQWSPDAEWDRVAVYGSGPFAPSDFVAFLKSLQIDCSEIEGPEALTYALVLGEEEWDKLTLDELIRNNTQGFEHLDYPIKVYSQQMYLFRVTTGVDPFDLPIDVLRQFAQEHPGLAYLISQGFDWPTSQSSGAGSGTMTYGQEWPQVGLLKEMGYKVGMGGIQDSRERREILAKVLTRPLPQVNSATYTAEWGAPGSSQRLSKMAESIAAFARSAKSRANPPVRAIEHWNSDLKWLQVTYYQGTYSFPWPFIR